VDCQPYGSNSHGHTHVYRAPKAACRSCPLRDQCGSKKKGPKWVRSIARSEDPAATAAFKAKMETEEAKAIYRKRSHRRVPTRLDQRAMWTSPVSMPWTREGLDGSYLGLPQLQHHSLVQHTTQAQCCRHSSSNCSCLSTHWQAFFSRSEPRTGAGKLYIALCR
jgi:adenine-specific DNA glycosylase